MPQMKQRVVNLMHSLHTILFSSRNLSVTE
jgi:hypothetical protein